jgi:hypothetical protein
MSDIITTATYKSTNPNWPAVLRIRLVAAILPGKPHQIGYVWTATDAGNGDKDATINAANLAPKRVYTTRAAAIAAAEKDGWIVTSDTHAASLGRKGGQAKTPAKSAAAKRRENSGLAKGREKLAALTPEQRSKNAKKAAAARWAKKKNEKKED